MSTPGRPKGEYLSAQHEGISMRQFPGAVLDIAYHLPERVVKNAEFQADHPDWRVDQTEKKTGVFERHIARADETAYDLALIAAQKLLAKHPALADKVDAIIFCTQSPDHVMPGNAFLLHRDLGLSQSVIAFDYNLACSGYVYGLMMASGFIKIGMAKNVLLVTADTYSKYIADDDRSTRMLFGDGASVSWIGEAAQFDGVPLIGAFEDFQCASDGKGWDKFIIKSGGHRQPPSQKSEPGYRDTIEMNGLHVLNLVNDRVIKQMLELLQKHELAPAQIDQFFLHQASGLALDSLGKKLRLGGDKLFSNLATVGNTVSSSIPILIKDYFSQASLAPGSRLFLCGFGVGYSWGSLLARK
jgi:3-oxoacyl-[acyl-carrier-protein] synthase-3